MCPCKAIDSSKEAAATEEEEKGGEKGVKEGDDSDNGDVVEVNPKHALGMQVLNVVGFLAVVLVNVLSSLGLLGATNVEVSDRYPTRFTPAGYAFSVWGLIYFFQAMFVIFQALPSQRTNPVLFHDIHLFYFATCVWNFIWSIIFTYDLIWASAVLISLLLITLLVIYVRLGIGSKKNVSLVEFYFIQMPFSLYSAWLSAATVVNISVALTGKSGWYGSPWIEEGWSVLMISIIGFITLVVLALRKDVAFGGVIAWALIAIAQKQKDYPFVPISGYVVGGVVAGVSFAILLWKVVRYAKSKMNVGDSSSSA